MHVHTEEEFKKMNCNTLSGSLYQIPNNFHNQYKNFVLIFKMIPCGSVRPVICAVLHLDMCASIG